MATSERPRSAIASAADSAQPFLAIASWCRPTCMLAGTATSIIFGLGSFRLFIRSTYSSIDFTLQARVEPLLFADGRDRVAFVIVGRIDHGFARAT